MFRFLKNVSPQPQPCINYLTTERLYYKKLIPLLWEYYPKVFKGFCSCKLFGHLTNYIIFYYVFVMVVSLN